MALFCQSPHQFSHPFLQLTALFLQGRIFRHLSQQLAELLTQLGIFRFQLGYTLFYSHGPIVAARAISYLSNYPMVLQSGETLVLQKMGHVSPHWGIMNAIQVLL